MSEERIAECRVRDGNFVEPCSALQECIAGSAFDKRKGVVQWNFMNMKTGEWSRSIIGIRSGQHAEKGIVFNYCPFCATKIDTPVVPADEAAAA